MAIHYPFSTTFCFRFAIIFEKRYGRHNMAKKILYRGLFSSLLYFLFIFYLPISCICSLGLSIVEVITEISSSIIEQIKTQPEIVVNRVISIHDNIHEIGAIELSKYEQTSKMEINEQKHLHRTT